LLSCHESAPAEADALRVSSIASLEGRRLALAFLVDPDTDLDFLLIEDPSANVVILAQETP
jgi:hypothetical protein